MSLGIVFLSEVMGTMMLTLWVVAWWPTLR